MIVDYDTIRTILEQTYRQKPETLDITDLVNKFRKVCMETNYSEVSSYIKEQTKGVVCKYSKGTYLTGPQGYYYPSELKLLMVTNMKKGRLVKNGDRSDYIYKYDKDGNIKHILMPDGLITTYCLEQTDVQFRITYADYMYFTYANYNTKGGPEIRECTAELKNPNGRTLCLIEIGWMPNMKKAFDVNIEIYDTEQSTGCWIQTTSNLPDPFDPSESPESYQVLEVYNFSLKYDEKMKLVDYRRVYSSN